MSSNKYVLVLDATAIAEFDSFQEAKKFLNENRTFECRIGNNTITVDSDDVAIMSEEGFNLL